MKKNNLSNNYIFILIGPSGVGKKTISNKVFKFFNQKLIPITSATTREKRKNEKEGIDYYFISQQEFQNKINHNEFVEHKKYVNNYYGTLWEELISKQKKNNVLLEIDIEGAINIKKQIENTISIFLLPPNIYSLKQRILHRQPDMSPGELNKRLQTAKLEISQKNMFDYVVKNKYVKDAVDKTIEIIGKYLN